LTEAPAALNLVREERSRSWLRSGSSSPTTKPNVPSDNPRAAARLLEHIRTVSDLLAEHPSLGREGRVKGTRELVAPGVPYIIAYRVVSDEVQTLTVMHAARRWPSRL
jgi:toxin ParE1/3/4